MSSSDADRAAGRTSPFPSARRGGALSPPPSASLTDEHLTEALANSPDNGATLDFTHKSLTDVGEDGAERLATVGRNESFAEESSITRIALGYNRLATLPTAFALLSRLRYLNLKNNSFSVFPDVLTLIPSLEILDISRNKLKRLPTQPGSLINLHVLCISRNKITRLPAYLGDFGSLDVLKVDHNPLEWPSRAILELNTSSTDPQVMKDWVRSLKKWLRENSHPRLDIKPSVDSLASERAAVNSSFDDVSWSWTTSGEEDTSGGPTPHARTFSVDNQFPTPPPPRPPRTAPSPRPERPPPLTLGPLPPYDPPLRSGSPASYLPTPEESVSSTDDDHTTVPDGYKHYRNGSLGTRDRRPALFGKKSLPDLHASPRPNELVHNVPYIEPVIAPVRTISLSRGKLRKDFVMPSALLRREDSSSSSEGCSQQKVQSFTTTPPSSASPTSSEHPHPIPDVERHAYFKRLSSLPANAANAISNNLSPSMCSLVECARSIYFSVSQVHQALSHYITYTINQKLSSVLRKVTDPAYAYMLQLNGSLERFDAVAKKTTPPPSLCKALVESSRDTAAVFGKAISMLSLQLKILASKDDDRYMRSLILIFYGAAAEMSHAWQSMLPHIDAIKSHLLDPRRIASHKTKNHLIPPSNNVEPSLASAPVGHTTFQYHMPFARSRPPTIGRARTTRRHAGSFSFKDVEIGKALPDYDLPPPPISISSATTLRAGPRNPGAPLSASTSSLVPPLLAGPTSAGVPVPLSVPLAPLQPLNARTISHSREASQTSLTTSSSSSSPQVPMRRPTLDIPQSRTLVDNDALDSMEAAVDSAPAIWELMKEMVETMPETPESSEDTRSLIEKAKEVTERLRVNIAVVRAGSPTADRRALREDAHVFVKTVVKLSNFIKTYGSSHEIFPDLRSKMVALTNSTQEFVMLLHVSSFSPATTPRPYSPLVSAPAYFNGIDDRLSASLSRSSNGQHPKALRLVAPGPSSVPRSALPSQTRFNTMPPPRYPMPTSAGIPGHGNWEVMRGEITADDG